MSAHHEIPRDPLTREARRLTQPGEQRETRARTKPVHEMKLAESYRDDFASRHPSAASLPKRLDECKTRTQAVKWLKHKYLGWFPHRWSEEEFTFYETFNKKRNK